MCPVWDCCLFLNSRKHICFDRGPHSRMPSQCLSLQRLIVHTFEELVLDANLCFAASAMWAAGWSGHTVAEMTDEQRAEKAGRMWKHENHVTMWPTRLKSNPTSVWCRLWIFNFASFFVFCLFLLSLSAQSLHTHPVSTISNHMYWEGFFYAIGMSNRTTFNVTYVPMYLNFKLKSEIVGYYFT